MLKSKVYQEYAKWWQFWLSKLPQNDTNQPLAVKGMMLKRNSFAISADRLSCLRNSAKAISPLRCPTAVTGLCVDEES